MNLKEFVYANQFLNESEPSKYGTPEDLILTGKGGVDDSHVEI